MIVGTFDNQTLATIYSLPKQTGLADSVLEVLRVFGCWGSGGSMAAVAAPTGAAKIQKYEPNGTAASYNAASVHTPSPEFPWPPVLVRVYAVFAASIIDSSTWSRKNGGLR